LLIDNIGRIFNPEDYDMKCAKSPQAVVFENFVRIYFSDCKQDGDKIISYVCFADFSKDFKRVLGIEKQIISDGKLGAFDEHGIFPFSPVMLDGNLFAYTSGWSRRESVSIESGIGLALSEDGGISFERVGEGPLLSANLNEPFLVMDGYVREYNDRYYIWYIYGIEWKNFKNSFEPERVYKITQGYSLDGFNWVRSGNQIIQSKIEDESQALPTVIRIKNDYHMVFCYRNSLGFRSEVGKGYRLGYANSGDLVNWIRKDEQLVFKNPFQEWENEMQCYPNLFEMDSKYYLLYNGNDFGKTGFGLAILEEIL